MINQPYEGATPEQLQHPMVREFLGVHNFFRNQLAAILQYANDLLSGERTLSAPETNERTRALIQAGSQYTQYLHAHHHIETSAMFPALHKEGLETTVIDRLNAEHDEIGVLIDKFAAAIRQFSTVEPDVLDSDLRRLADALQVHLSYEETHVCPLMARWSKWPNFHAQEQR